MQQRETSQGSTLENPTDLDRITAAKLALGERLGVGDFWNTPTLYELAALRALESARDAYLDGDESDERNSLARAQVYATLAQTAAITEVTDRSVE